MSESELRGTGLAADVSAGMDDFSSVRGRQDVLFPEICITAVTPLLHPGEAEWQRAKLK